MAFTPSTLVTVLTNNFRAELNSNFSKIQTDLIAIGNELPRVVGNQSYVSNLSAIEPMIRAQGVVGKDSFQPLFNTDGDVFEIQHSSSVGFSSCVINSRFHNTSVSYTKNLSELCTGDGTYDMVFGVQSKSAPMIEQKLLVAYTDEDSEIDLAIWRFQVLRSGTDYYVSNLRLACDTIASRESFSFVHDTPHPLTLAVPGDLPRAYGALSVGLIVPWDCQVDGAFMRLETGPAQTDGVSVDLVTGLASDAESVVAAPASWGVGDGGTVVELAAIAEPKQLAAGTYVYPCVTVPEQEPYTDGPHVVPTAADLTVTLLVRRLPHAIL